MKIYDISGNEITGKEVVFTHYVGQYGLLEPKVRPESYEKIIYLGSKPSRAQFFCAYKDNTPAPFIYIGHLKDK